MYGVSKGTQSTAIRRIVFCALLRRPNRGSPLLSRPSCGFGTEPRAPASGYQGFSIRYLYSRNVVLNDLALVVIGATHEIPASPAQQLAFSGNQALAAHRAIQHWLIVRVVALVFTVGSGLRCGRLFVHASRLTTLIIMRRQCAEPRYLNDFSVVQRAHGHQ